VGPQRLVDSIKKRFPSAVSRFVVSVAEDWGGFSQAEIFSRLEPLVADYEQKRQVAGITKVMATDGRMENLVNVQRSIEEQLAARPAN
jgi:hypothetical protein